MPPKRKFVRARGKKRKFHGNCFLKAQTLDSSEVSDEKEVEETEHNTSSSSEPRALRRNLGCYQHQNEKFPMNHQARMKIYVMMD